MKFPKELNVLGYNLKLVFEKDLGCKYCKRKLAGKIYGHKNKIAINKNQSKSQQLLALYHELGHIFAQYYDLENCEVFAEAFSRYVLMINKQLRFR